MNELSHIFVDTIFSADFIDGSATGVRSVSSHGLALGTILLLIFGTIIMYVCFYFVNEYVIKLVQNRRARTTAKRFFPIITSFIWLGYFIYVGYVILEPYPLIGIAVVLILLLGF